MNEKFEYQGYWWLPGADEDEVPGILKFDPDEDATLDLLGSLKGLRGVIDPLEPEIILGRSSHGKLITLKDCGRTLGNLAIGRGFSTSSFAVNEIFVGQHFEQAEDVGFERLVVEYLHLEAWAHASVFEIEMIDQPDVQPLTVRHKIAESMTATVKNGYEVTLFFGSYREWSRSPVTWGDHYPARRACHQVSGEGALRSPQRYRLPSPAPLEPRDEEVCIPRRRARLHGSRGGGDASGRPLQDARQDGHSPGEAGVARDALLSPSPSWGFGPAVARWLEGADKLDPVYRLFLGTLYNPSAYIEQQFLSLVTALEVYHRRAMSAPDPPEKHDRRKREILEAVPNEHKGWLERELAFSHEPTLLERLHEIFRRHLEVAQAVVGRSKKARADFIQEVVDARNYRAHFGERLEGRAARGAELHPINQKLKQLVEACLMAEIGFGGDEIKKAIMGLR